MRGTVRKQPSFSEQCSIDENRPARTAAKGSVAKDEKRQVEFASSHPQDDPPLPENHSLAVYQRPPLVPALAAMVIGGAFYPLPLLFPPQSSLDPYIFSSNPSHVIFIESFIIASTIVRCLLPKATTPWHGTAEAIRAYWQNAFFFLLPCVLSSKGLRRTR